MRFLPGMIAALQIEEVRVPHPHQPFDGPEAAVAALAVHNDLFVLLELFDLVADFRQRHVYRTRDVPSLVFLVRAHIETYHALFLVKIFRRDLFYAEPPQEPEQLDDKPESHYTEQYR